jgi:hypothetical protein
MDDDVDSREAARNRRRDRDAAAAARELMRPGMGKVFKQIQDVQRRVADELPDGARDTTADGSGAAARDGRPRKR